MTFSGFGRKYNRKAATCIQFNAIPLNSCHKRKS